MSLISPKAADVKITIAQAGGTAAPTVITDGFTSLGIKRLLVNTNPDGAITDINFTVWVWQGGTGGGWGVFAISGSLAAALSSGLTFEPEGAERIYIQTTTATGGNVGYFLTFTNEGTA